MADRASGTGAWARVVVEIEVTLAQGWPDDATVAQVRTQATREAKDAVEGVLADAQRRGQLQGRVVGTTVRSIFAAERTTP